ncbi:MAG: RHS repeat-associated core domain-containing protein [Bacteroidales bacterium]|nr:RHS repeat-associated core domain-containing protein [Bacteroidales bacterium]MCF8390549.1 RHS repeat-associated core domain-containing protein [Bacteroidales bacterium]
MSLKRINSAGTLIDNLTYYYAGGGNKLTSVEDIGTPDGFKDSEGELEYSYDDNGNMTLDLNKELQIEYNYLNLPERIASESLGNDGLIFIYDASGRKWQKLTIEEEGEDEEQVTKTTTYNGSFIYDGAKGSMDLDYALTPEGMIETPSTPKYHYFLKDHLGNTRATIADMNGNGILDDLSNEVLQTADYYPFGMQHYSQGGNNKYLYNGKEFQDDEIEGVGLDWYDYGFRFYDPAIGRWHTPDPLMELLQEPFTPYQYCLNNPILHTDPDGRIVPVIIGAIILGKAIAGAAIDGGVQYGINRAQGMTHNDAMNNLDYTSMFASGVISGVSAPGISTSVKNGIRLTSIALDATVDVSSTSQQTAFGIGGADPKPFTDVTLDAAFGFIDGKMSDGIVNGSKNAVSGDLKPSNYAPLDASSKHTVRTTENIVNSSGFEQGVNAATNVTSGAVNETIKSTISSGAMPQNGSIKISIDPGLIYTPPLDNLRIEQPIIL